MSRFAVEVVREPGYAILRTNGYINNLGAERIEQEYDALVSQGCRSFIVNFARHDLRRPSRAQTLPWEVAPGPRAERLFITG